MLWYFPQIYTILNACDGVGILHLVNCLICAFLVEIAKNAKKLLIIFLIRSIINS